MQRLEVSGAVRPIYVSLGIKRWRNCVSWMKIAIAKQTFGQLAETVW